MEAIELINERLNRIESKLDKLMDFRSRWLGGMAGLYVLYLIAALLIKVI